MSGKTRVVVFWVDANKVSIEELSRINEDDRFVGAPTSIKAGNKNHPAIVKCISKDDAKLNECEERVAEEIDKILAQRGKDGKDKRSRNQRHRRVLPHEAPEMEVAAAVGEKLKPSHAQKEQKKKVSKIKKQTKQAQEAAQDDIDVGVLNVKRSLAFDDSESESNALDQNDNVTLKRYDAFEGSENEKNEEEEEDEGEDVNMSDGDEGNGSESKNSDRECDDEENTFPDCCNHCLELQSAASQSPANFNKAVVKFLSDDLFTGKSGNEVQYLEVKKVRKGVPKSELSKGSKVYISVHDKNSIKANGGGDPSKMTRDTMIKLFGRDTLEQEDVTAVGTKKGSKGIHPKVRSAVLSFVNRNRNQDSYKALTPAQFNKVINRKKNQVQRTKAGPSPVPKKGSKKTKSSTSKNTTSISPGKGDSALNPQSADVATTSAASSTPAKSSKSKPPMPSVQSTSPWKIRHPTDLSSPVAAYAPGPVANYQHAPAPMAGYQPAPVANYPCYQPQQPQYFMNQSYSYDPQQGPDVETPFLTNL